MLTIVTPSANGDFQGTLPAYEEAYRSTDNPFLAFIHDDVEIHDDRWEEWVMSVFQEESSIGVIGFAGALQFGHPDIYKRTYRIADLMRYGFKSNLENAEQHGERWEGSCNVAFLDGFALIVRRELLDKMGGWQPDKWPPHHVYDLRLACEARRHGYRMRLVGISCAHRGGTTSCSPGYQEWARTTKWGSDLEMHKQGHRMIYDEYMDVLPWSV